MIPIPEALISSLRKLDGFDAAAFREAHDPAKKVVSIRLNPAKQTTSPFDGMQQIPWSSNGYYLPSRPQFIFDPLIHAGAYYVQEPSSMFIEQCIRQHTELSASLRVLDLCAAPGGKSTLLQSLISPDSLLVSNEVIKTRVSVLVENLVKWGGSNVIVTNNDPRDFAAAKSFFDVLVIDAPCSGSGLFRRDPSAIGEWSPEAVTSCSLRQRRIVTDAYDCLRQGGLLVYSTCSYSFEENEDICDWICATLEVEPLPVRIDPEWRIVSTFSEKAKAPGYRFFPDRLKGEGFFVACFRKKDGATDGEEESARTKLKKLNARESAILQPWVAGEDSFFYYRLGDEVFAFPRNLERDLDVLNKYLYTKLAGTAAGKPINTALIPAHSLALSQIVHPAIQSISLKKDAALQYLRREEVTIGDAKKGWALVNYEALNLGWVKLLHNRINNYYPKEWRILKSAVN